MPRSHHIYRSTPPRIKLAIASHSTALERPFDNAIAIQPDAGKCDGSGVDHRCLCRAGLVILAIKLFDLRTLVQASAHGK